MSKNVGNVDRTVRIILGLICIAYAIPIGFSHTGWNWTGWVLGVLLIGSALLGICPGYKLFGISTNKS